MSQAMDVSRPTLRHYGDRAVLVEWPGDRFDAGVSDAVHALADRLRQADLFIDVMPGYNSLVASFDGAALTVAAAERQIKNIIVQSPDLDQADLGHQIDIPVNYGGAEGPDLYTLAETIGKTPEEVIALHSGRTYRVCMMGFIPGFAFLSEVDPVLQHPRHATPRAKVPAGSVGIANWQTGIYGLESPGGWQIIGRTDLTMFNADREKPFLAEAGDRIRFVPQ